MNETLTAMEWVPVDSLLLDPSNARLHPDRNLNAIRASLRRFGQQKPIVVDGDNIVRAGNGTLAAAKAEGWSKIAVVRTALKGAEAMAYALVDNRTGELAEWDERILAQQTVALEAEGFGLDASWWDGSELMDLSASVSDLAGAGAESDEQMLAKINVTLREPQTVVVPGEVYQLNGRHMLVIADVVTEAATWAPLLSITDLFCPYPGIFVPLCEGASEKKLLMVQPEPYLAGHLLDQYKAIYGADAVERVRAPK